MGSVSLQNTRSIHKNQSYFCILAMNNPKIKLRKQFHAQQNQNMTTSYFSSETCNNFLPQSKIPVCSSCLVRLSNDLTSSYFSNLISFHCPSHSLCFSPIDLFSALQVWQVCCLELLLHRQLHGLLLHFFLLLHLCSNVSVLERVSLITDIKQYPYLHPHCSLSPYISVHTHMHTHTHTYPTVFRKLSSLQKSCKKGQSTPCTVHLVLPTSMCISQEQGHSLNNHNKIITLKKNYIGPMLLSNLQSTFKVLSSNNFIYIYFFFNLGSQQESHITCYYIFSHL